jgi:L-lactate dehydrogenase complex protein LldG
MSKADILQSIRRNKVACPASPEPLAKDTLLLKKEALIDLFRQSLKNAGAEVVELKAAEIAGYMAATWPGVLDFDLPETRAEYPAACPLEKLDKVEHAAFTGTLGIAENGAIWLEEKNMPHRILPFITQHLILKIDTAKIIPTMQTAYGQIRLDDLGFGVFISGPSKTADIEQSLVYGAHGAKELTVILYEA